jgi:hypothetical protein
MSDYQQSSDVKERGPRCGRQLTGDKPYLGGLLMRTFWTILICVLVAGCETQRDRGMQQVDEKRDKAADTRSTDAPIGEANPKPATDRAKLAEMLDEEGAEKDPFKQQEINAARRAVGLPEVKYETKSDAP